MFDMLFDGKPWFAPKRFGYGSGAPIAWQGWGVVALHVLLVVGVTLPLVRLRSDLYHGHGMAMLLIEMAIIVVPLPLYAAKTRGGWKWRWGDEA